MENYGGQTKYIMGEVHMEQSISMVRQGTQGLFPDEGQFFKKLKVLPNGNLMVGQMSSRSLGCCEDLNMSWKRGEDHEKINMAPPQCIPHSHIQID